MRFWTVAVFDREETAVIEAAQRSINIGFPTEGPDAVDPDDPRRRVLRGLASRNDPLTADRLKRGEEVLDELLAVIESQMTRSYWENLADAVIDDRAATAVTALVEARTTQRQEVLLALFVVREALHRVGAPERHLDDAVERAEMSVQGYLERRELMKAQNRD